MKLTKDNLKDTVVKELVKKLSERVDFAIKNQLDVSEYHNAYVDYCLVLLFLSTGHRPVKDPFQSRQCFNIEQGMITISDKVVEEGRAWRVVPLPPMACKQIEYYEAHLQRLNRRLATQKGSEDLVLGVQSLFSENSKVPFFFYLKGSNPSALERITPASISKRIEDLWEFPLYLFRHVYATKLTEYDKNPRLRQALMGHDSGPDHQFGKTSDKSVLASFSEVAAHIEHFMQDLDGVALPTKLRTVSIVKTIVSPVGKTEKAKAYVLGVDRRKLERKERRKQIASIVRLTIKEIMGQEKVLPSVEQLKEILERVTEIAHLRGLSKNHCVFLIKRYFGTYPGGKNLLSQVTKSYEPQSEASPFNESSIEAYEANKKLRSNFILYLSEQPKVNEETKIEKRLAEIVVSSALFSGMADVNKLSRLDEALLRCVYQLDGELFVDIPLSDDQSGPVFRWYPDELSTTLIIGLYKQFIVTERYSKTELKKHLNSILKLLKINKPKIEQLVLLVDAAKDGVIFEVPGHIASCLFGETKTVSIPLPQLMRYHSGMILPDRDLLTSPKIKDSSAWLIGVSCLEKDSTIDEIRNLQRTLRKLFSEAENQKNSGSGLPFTRYKRSLIELIKQEFSKNAKDSWSSLSFSIVAWIVYLCEKGTRTKKDLAYSTIKEYSSLVIRALVNFQPTGNFLTLDAEGYEEIYLNIIENIPDNQKHNIAGRLREFHAFLVNDFAVEEPSWSSVLAPYGILKEENFSDANVVSEKEYLRILEAINSDDSLGIRKKKQYLVLLIMGYRFGMRFGEAYRLRYVDVMVDEGTDISVLVRNSIYGQTKTESGNRVVSLLETLKVLESEAIKGVVSYAAAHFKDDKQAALMAKNAGGRDLIDRFVTASYLGKYIKGVTGDSRLRFHHLRHSWATRLYSTLLQSKLSTGLNMASKSVDQKSIDRNIYYGATSKPLSSLANMIGHQSESTTLESYIHSVDKVSQNLISLEGGAKLVPAYAYALGITEGNVRQRLSRKLLYVAAEEIPTPKVTLKEFKGVNFTIDKGRGKEIPVSLVEIEMLLKRFLLTKQSVEQIGSQMMIEPALAKEIVSLAAKIERRSGYEFYQADFVNRDKLFAKPEIQFQQIKQNKKGGERITAFLKDIEADILALSDDGLRVLKEGLEVWRDTLKRRQTGSYINIVTDQDEKEKLIDGMRALPLGVEVVHFSQQTDAVKGIENEDEIEVIYTDQWIPKPLEKTKLRQESGLPLYIKPGRKLVTQQSLYRVLMALSVYVL